MASIHKKREVKSDAKPLEAKSEVVKTEPVVVSEVITETIEVVEEITPKETKPEAESLSRDDPMSDFKSKMMKEEMFLPDESRKKNFMWPILLIFIIAIALLVGIFLYKQGMFKGEKINEVILTPAPVITAEPTRTIDLTKYEIEIQNGGGVAGEASRQKAILEEAGFAVASVDNADNTDYTDTIIQAKAEVEKEFIAKLKDVLSESFTIGESEDLSKGSAVSVVVILGTKK